jgi:hypothetical protein
MTSKGFPCANWATRGKLRCRLHGGAVNSGRHLSEDVHHSRSLAKARAAVVWPHPTYGIAGGLSRAETARRLPNGRFAVNAKPRQERDKTIVRAQSIIRIEEMKKRKDASVLSPVVPQPVPPVVPWSNKTKGEKLSELVDLSLEQNRRILSLEFDPDDRSPANLKLISILSNTALQVISQRAKLDRGILCAVDEAERQRREILEHMSDVFEKAAKEKP